MEIPKIDVYKLTSIDAAYLIGRIFGKLECIEMGIHNQTTEETLLDLLSGLPEIPYDDRDGQDTL